MTTQKIDDVNIAAMVCSLGFSQERNAIQIQKRNGKIQFVYFFKPTSDCGQYKLKECLEAWTDDDFINENPFHELSVMKTFNLNRLQLLGEIKAKKGMLTEFDGDGVSGLINLESTAAELQKLMGS